LPLPVFGLSGSRRNRPTSIYVSEPNVPAVVESNAPDVSDVVVHLAVAGDEAAQRQVYDRHADRIHRLAWRMTGDKDLAEDLTQDVFVRALDRIHQFRGDARLGTWLYQLAVSVILNGMRKRRSRVQRERPLPDEMKADSGPLHVDPVLRERVRDAVRRLPEDLRIVVLMYDVEGYSHNDIAQILGISSGACRMRLSRAREQLRDLLSAEGAEWRE
jgi:RNA polymerase sigma-70 factor (ECF subfamily)